MASISLDGKFQFNYEKAKYWDSEKLNELEDFTLNKNDLIIAMTDVTPDKKLIGRMAIVDIDDTFLLNQRVGLLKLKSNINHMFLSNYSNYTKWRSYSKNIAALGAQANLSTKDIKEAKIPLPPLKEQEKIADILSTADDKIDAITSQIEKAQILKNGLLQKLLSEGIGHSEFKDSELGKIPESWEVVNVENITASHKQGYYTKDEYTGQGIYLIRITDLGNPKIDYTDMPKLPISDDDYKSFKVSKGDFLFARSGAIGRYGIVYEDYSAVFASYLIRFTFKKDKGSYVLPYAKNSNKESFEVYLTSFDVEEIEVNMTVANRYDVIRFTSCTEEQITAIMRDIKENTDMVLQWRTWEAWKRLISSFTFGIFVIVVAFLL